MVFRPWASGSESPSENVRTMNDCLRRLSGGMRDGSSQGEWEIESGERAAVGLSVSVTAVTRQGSSRILVCLKSSLLFQIINKFNAARLAAAAAWSWVGPRLVLLQCFRVAACFVF